MTERVFTGCGCFKLVLVAFATLSMGCGFINLLADFHAPLVTFTHKSTYEYLFLSVEPSDILACAVDTMTSRNWVCLRGAETQGTTWALQGVKRA